MIWLVGPDGDLAVTSVEELTLFPDLLAAAAGYTWVFSVAQAFALSRERSRR
jgi:hypothetical protein